MIRFNSGILDYKQAIAVPAAATYPTTGLIDRWSFNNTLTGLNGNSWAADGGMAYDYAAGQVAGGNGVRITSPRVAYAGGRLYLNESVFSTFDSASVSATIAFWFKAPMVEGDYPGIFGKGNLHTQPAWKGLVINGTGSTFTTWYGGNFGGDVNATVSISANAWHHYCMTMVKTGANAGQFYAYIDNAQVISITTQFPQINTNDFQLFRVWQNQPAAQYTMIQNMYIYSRVLDSTERAQLYNGGAGV